MQVMVDTLWRPARSPGENRTAVFAVFLVLAFSALNAQADLIDGVSIGAGYSTNDTAAYRLGLRKTLEARWWDSEVGYLSAYFEGGIHYWERRDGNLYGLAFSPVLTYNFDKIHAELVPYVEGGLGVAYLSETRMGRRDLSTHFQFEDRIGFGGRFGEKKRHDLNFRYIHYSNGSIKEPNQGMEFFVLSYILHF
jgi:lipid A 3-O-deacylase